MRKVFMKFTEGCCNRRVLDFEAIKKYFEQNNFLVVDSPKEAQIICLQTCAFVKRTEDIAIREIDEILKEYPNSELIVTGCLPGINLQRLRKRFTGTAINTVDLQEINNSLGQQSYHLDTVNNDANGLFFQKEIISKIPALISVFRFFTDNFSRDLNFWRTIFRNTRNIVKAGMGLSRKHWYIRIGWGCMEGCTFCVEKRAIGSEIISKPIDLCVKELKEGVRRGYKNMFITADSPAAWGVEIGKSFPELLKALLEAEPSFIISDIDGIHPYWVNTYMDDFCEVLSTGRIKTLMIPLQSGSNRILKLMHRRYTKEQFLKIIAACKSAYADIVLISQAIVGFPTETFEEFKESVDTFIEAGMTNVAFFPFYPHPETPAGKMGDQISDEEKFRRVDYGVKKTGRTGIYSLGRSHEINPKYQKTKALYDKS